MSLHTLIIIYLPPSSQHEGGGSREVHGSQPYLLADKLQSRAVGYGLRVPMLKPALPIRLKPACPVDFVQ